MTHVPSYPKVLTLGSYMTENALVGNVVVQEKADGSQFGAGVDADGNVCYRSHGQQITPGAAGMFEPIVSYLESCNLATTLAPDTFFYGEFFAKPKQNALAYGRTPKNGLMVFDFVQQGQWKPDGVPVVADWLDLEPAPVLWRGEISVEGLTRLVEETNSFLGEQRVEGVVIKNYGQTIEVNGKLQPLITKLVRKEFKERNDKEHPSKKATVDDLIESVRTEARWMKAIQHMREDGTLLNAPQDIGPLIRAIQEDVVDESEEDIKQALWRIYKDQFLRKAIAGFPDWYKDRLLERAQG